MSCDDFIKTAWNDHADDAQGVAGRLASSLDLLAEPKDVPPYAQLVVHVYGEHLGRWRDGIGVLDSIRALPAFAAGDTAVRPLARGIATLRHAAGEEGALQALSDEDRVSVMAAAAAALAGRREFKRAIAEYANALQQAGAGLPAGSPAIRALAIGGNNLAAALEEKKDRDAEETEGMLRAAQGGLDYWKQAGTWLEEERAEYRLTRSLLQAGRAVPALQSAQRCIEVCERNQAPAIESFFGYCVLALARRAAGDAAGFDAARAEALRLLEQVPADERQWCEGDLKDIAAA